jgi:hypothetical protein
MSRNLSANMVTATSAPTITPIIFVRADFASGAVRVHSGYGTLTFLGESYTGTGHLGKISAIEEDTDLAVYGVSFELSGIPSEYIALFLTEQYQGRSIRAWLALMDSAGTLQSGEYEFFTGRMDYAKVQEDVENATISIQAENELADLRRSRERRFTHEEAMLRFPTEKGFEYVTSLQNRTIMWGRVYKAGESSSGGMPSNGGKPPGYVDIPNHPFGGGF